MKKLYLFLFFLLIPLWVFACMPPSPWEVMIGRIDSLDETSSWVLDVGFSSYGFPFRDYTYDDPTSWKYRPYSDLTLRQEFPKDIQSGSLIIALSDSQDGSYPYDYSIFHITTLSCKDDVLGLGKTYGTVMWWDRKSGKCGYKAHSLIDVFPDWDEDIWLKKLQEKYPTCASLGEVFPTQKEITKTVTNTLSLENDIVERTPFSWLDWILGKIDVFFRLF